MATKLVPTDAGITGTQLEIPFKQGQPKIEYRQPAQPIPEAQPLANPPQQSPRVPTNQRGTFQSFRL